MTLGRILKSTFACLLVAALLAGAIELQDQLIKRRRAEPFRFRDTLYLPDSRYVQAISLGYDQFAADFLWLRMIQSFAAGWSRPENAQQMMNYFNVITDLDPKFIPTYSFSIMAVGEGAHQDQMVHDIVRKAMLKVPNNYVIPKEGAFYAYWQMKNTDLAKYYVRMARKDPNCPAWVDRWEGYFDMKGGRYYMAYEKFLKDYVHALDAHNYQIINIYLNQLVNTVNEWMTDKIRQAAVKWHNEKGDWPTVEQLDAAGAFKGVELPDWGRMLSALDRARDDKVPVARTDDELELFIKRTIVKWDKLPPGPFDFMKPTYPGFVIWRGLPSTDERFVMPRGKLLGYLKELMDGVHTAALVYLEAHGKPPADWTDVAPAFKEFPEPFGGKWVWDAKTMEMYPSTYPNLRNMNIPTAFY
ncbi:MAG: hypothetical protein M1457_03040 [bacterium]|nr:hypothetical protein [bacterium]